MLELRLHKIYPAKIKNFISFVNEENEEFIAIYPFLDNFYIKELYEQITSHNNVELVEHEGEEVEVLPKTDIISILISVQKSTSDLRVGLKLADMVKLLNSNHTIIPSSSVQDVYKDINLDDIVTVKVNAILPYGAMVNLVDEPSITGIIHISEIYSGFVSDVALFFRVGEIVNAKVVKKVPEDFKLNLSTKEKYDKSHFDQNIVDEISFNVQEKKSKVIIPKEYSEIEEFIASKTGVLSNDAKSKLLELIENYGVFKFSLKLNSVTEGLVPDVGLMFLNHLDEVISSLEK